MFAYSDHGLLLDRAKYQAVADFQLSFSVSEFKAFKVATKMHKVSGDTIDTSWGHAHTQTKVNV